jgi:choline kinase
MHPIEHVVIAAAGIGSRLGMSSPKCLLEIGSHTLLQRHLHQTRQIKNIWLVTGYHEEEVIAHAIECREDVLIARNPDYAKTNTLQSLFLVSRFLNERFLMIDGDTIIRSKSLEGFLASSQTTDLQIGFSRHNTSDGVRMILNADQTKVIGFTRDHGYKMEWPGIAVIDPSTVKNDPCFVYEALSARLPLPAREIDAFDIDTSEDLDMARRIMRNA